MRWLTGRTSRFPVSALSCCATRNSGSAAIPRPGSKSPITPRRVLTFRASQILKDRIAEGLTQAVGGGDTVAVDQRFSDGKEADALRTIGEVARALGIKQHVLRYWEQQFPMLKPLKRSGGRR